MMTMNCAPFVLMSVEWAFNQMPFEIRMLPFDITIFLVYILINVAITEATEVPLYANTDWINKPVEALLYSLLSFVLMTAIFLGLWLLTEKWKLPKFQRRI